MGWEKTFRELYSDRFGCPAEVFETRVFWRTLHRRSLPLALLVYLFDRDFFRLDLLAIRQLGVTQSAREFRAEVDLFCSEYRMQRSFLRKTLRLRISGRRLMQVLNQVAPADEDWGQT